MSVMKKRVLIIMPSMFIGGAERSVLGLMDAFDYSKYDVSLFLYRQEGEFLPYINPKVHLLNEIPEYKTFDVPVKSLLLSTLFISGLLRVKAKIEQEIHAKRTGENGVWMHMQKISKNLQQTLPPIPGTYDFGIMFLGIPDTLVNKVNAKVKIAWNHTDYTTLGPDTAYDRKVYSAIDYIVSVSKECRKQFLKVYPELKQKAIVIENILSAELIQRLSEESVDDMDCKPDEISVLSIGRYSYAKNFDNVPDICRRILDKGLKIKWYIIGYGGDEELINNAIAENRMENNVILLGKRINPYPYIKKCDVYIQPSRFEGKAVTVREAQILGKPVIITDYATAHSQLEDRTDGIIVHKANIECAEDIAKVLKDKALLEKIASECSNRDYTNSSQITELMRIAEEFS